MAYQIPGNIAELDDEALSNAVEEAFKAGNDLAKLDDEALTDDQLAEFEAISNFVTEAKAVQAERTEAAAQRAEKIAALRQSVTKPEEPKEGEDADEAPAADPAAPADAPAEPVVEPVVEEIPAELPALPAEEAVTPADEEIASEDDTEKEKASMVASAPQKASLADAARNAPKATTEPVRSRISLTAAANVPNVAAGKEFSSLADASSVITQSLKALPTSGANTIVKSSALAFAIDNEFVQKRDGDDLELLLAAGAESRLKGNSLVAAGGWGAPSETILDFCDIEVADGLIDIPEVTITRGGVNYTKGISFESVMASDEGFWDMSEATAEAGVEQKTSLRPELPTFTEKRMDAVGVMVEAGLLLRKGWPEVIERTTKLAMLAHQFKMHHKVIGQIQAYTGAAKSVPNGFGNALDVLHILDVVAQGERQRNALSLKHTLEVLLPEWVKAVLRADLSNRNGVDFLSVTDAQITAWFSARNLRVQWLNHYIPLDVPAGGIATKYPDFAEAIMYPAGTYVKGTSEVLTLNTIYDSVNLKKNDYVHLFTEQGIVVTNPCNDGRRISIPIGANGRTGAADITNDLFAVPTP